MTYYGSVLYDVITNLSASCQPSSEKFCCHQGSQDSMYLYSDFTNIKCKTGKLQADGDPCCTHAQLWHTATAVLRKTAVPPELCTYNAGSDACLTSQSSRLGGWRWKAWPLILFIDICKHKAMLLAPQCYPKVMGSKTLMETL